MTMMKECKLWVSTCRSAVLLCGVVLGLVSCSGSGSASRNGDTSTAPKTSAAAPNAPASAPAATPASATASTAAPVSAPAAVPAVQRATVCTGQPFCYEAGDFAAMVTGFRTSISGGYRVIDATVRFQNKTPKPLILGYALASGIAVDEKGNRYAVGGPNGYRGIGYVNGQSFDPKFVVQPGSFGDARFELVWAPGNAIVGSTFELDLTVNEINTVEGNQHTLGGEFPMEFRGLANELPGAKSEKPAQP